MSRQTITLSIVCPFFNEQNVVNFFLKETTDVLDDLKESYEILCINDGSTDNTLSTLIQAKRKYSQIRIINFSRNFGKEGALSAGLDYARGDVVILIDADLQDPPELIKELVSFWKQGYDVVLAKRTDRSSDTFIKRLSAQLFYKIHNKISTIKIPENVGDCRLMTRRVVESVKLLPENQRFMKGIFSWVGFNAATVEYKRNKRIAGTTKFSGWKLWNFALEGITSFSTVPLRIWLYIGAIVSLLSFIYGSFIILRTLFLGVDVPGYASLLTSILFLGGIQLLGIGVLGEYIGRIYLESKSRPLYIIENQY